MTAIEAINAIGQRISDLNTYFVESFLNVSKDISGVDIAHSLETVLFPNDSIGNYFYIYQTGDIQWQAATEIRSCRIVAYVQDGDAEKVMQNLKASLLLRNCGFGVVLKNGSVSPEAVIRQEVNRKNVNAALKNYKENVALIFINFDLILPRAELFNSQECILNPCNNCN